MRRVKSAFHKFAIRSMFLAGTIALLATSVLTPKANAQIVIGIQPVCSYGYYDYAPYACAPMGFYGPGYFFNGIFLGVGPWANWGYGHGWGGHRFSGGGGGRYVAGQRGGGGYHGENRGSGRSEVVSHNSGSRGRSATQSHATASHSRPSASHTAQARGGASHGGSSHGASHAAAGHSGGSHGGGERH
ncbi:MAG: hypothetical protein WB817_08675 [Terriglobales bacterium]